MQYTAEQEKIIKDDSHILLINAFAGTGKTSTLIGYAEARPNAKILYLAFNKSIKQEAEKKFPKNVKCLTTHGLAYPVIGYKFKNKLGNNQILAIAKEFCIDYKLAKRVIRIIDNFIYSLDKEINQKHDSTIEFESNIQTMEIAKKSWDLMCDASNEKFQMTHDGYLKLYQLSNPVLDYDYILVDEAQDSNNVVVDIIMQQKANKVFVGDKHQAIYGFRKTINVFKKLKKSTILNLSTSFRFGNPVAKVANSILSVYKTEEVKILSTHGMGMVYNNQDMQFSQYTIISRTNSALFDTAVKELRGGKSIAYVGGVESYKLDLIYDAFTLKYKGHESLRSYSGLYDFKSWEDFLTYAEESEDVEYSTLIKIVMRYTTSIPSLVMAIRNNAVKNFKHADVVLTTAHKSKGLEFDNVVLCGDFPPIHECHRDEIDIDEEEVNLLYVASTRAKFNLVMNKQCMYSVDINKKELNHD